MKSKRAFELSLIGVGLFVTTLSLTCGAVETVLGLPKVEILYSDPEQALKDGKPVRIEREAQYVKKWDVWVLAERRLYWEGQDIVVSLRDKHGKTTATFPAMTGPFFIFETERRIIDCGWHSYPKNVAPTVVFDDSGKVVKKIQNRYFMRNCATTDDAQLLWMHYHAVENSVPLNVLHVIDPEGETVYRVKKRTSGEATFIYKSRSYKITLPAPEHPG